QHARRLSPVPAIRPLPHPVHFKEGTGSHRPVKCRRNPPNGTRRVPSPERIGRVSVDRSAGGAELQPTLRRQLSLFSSADIQRLLQERACPACRGGTAPAYPAFPLSMLCPCAA